MDVGSLFQARGELVANFIMDRAEEVAAYWTVTCLLQAPQRIEQNQRPLESRDVRQEDETQGIRGLPRRMAQRSQWPATWQVMHVLAAESAQVLAQPLSLSQD